MKKQGSPMQIADGCKDVIYPESMAAKIFGSHGSVFMYHLANFTLRTRYLCRSSLASSWEKYLALKKLNRNAVSVENNNKKLW